MPARPSRRAIAIAIAAAAIVGGVVGGTALAASSARPPARALQVFLRPMTTDEQVAATAVRLPDANVTTVRKVGAGDGWVAVVFRTGPHGGGRVCLEVTLLGSAAATCSTEGAFAADGLRLTLSARRLDGTLVSGDWRWGPTSERLRYAPAS
jgi:hypothetical protein